MRKLISFCFDGEEKHFIAKIKIDLRKLFIKLS